MQRITQNILIMFAIISFFKFCEVYREPNKNIGTTNNKSNRKKVIEKNYESILPLRSLVLVVNMGKDENKAKKGSGSIISSDGIVITNYHVIENNGGDFTNIIVGLNRKNPESEPDEFFKCKIIKVNKSYDLALLKINSTIGEKKVSSSYGFIPVKIGKSDNLNMGEEILILGYPALGQNTVTLTKGAISGWINDREIVKGWIKTDAEINQGNSGGMAINSKGELIGIPTAAVSDIKTVGKLGLIRPISFAIEILNFNN